MTGSPSGMSHVTIAEFAFTALIVTLTGGDKLSVNRKRDNSLFIHLLYLGLIQCQCCWEGPCEM